MQTNIKKKLYIFYMSGMNIIFDDETINKSSFCGNKKLFYTYYTDVNKIIVSKKEILWLKKVHLSTTLDMMIITTLDHYV